MPDGAGGADVVIVGAGTAGSVLAALLSRESSRRVILIDAGPGTPDPALAGLDYLGGASPGRFWEEDLVERVAGQPVRPYRSGRGIGGSAAVNGMVAVEPDAGDMAAWRAAGCPSWTAAAVGSARESLGGGWTPTAPSELGPLERAVAAAAEISGIGAFAPVALERSGDRRMSVADRLLGPALARPNLRLLADSAVRRVAVDGDRAVGVELANGSCIEAADVVVACGAIRSPLVLAASGLGDRLADGRLTDHPSGTFTLHLRDPLTSPLQTCGALRWRTASGATAELLPIAHVGNRLGALTLAIMDPVSTGSIAAAGEPVVARLQMLGDERDRGAMREAVGDALRLLDTAPFAALVERVSAGSLGSPAGELLDASDALLDRWVDATGTLLHAGCSLPLGSVLDECGRVPHVAGLRVIDAAALPVLPRVAPNAAVELLAAHLAATWPTPPLDDRFRETL